MIKKLNKSNKESFISKAKNVHNDKYNYDKVNYINNKTKIIIICQEHGDFIQRPDNHLNGQNCPLCMSCNTMTFVKKSKIIHDNVYNYDKVNYINNSTKVIITCYKHGDFEQQPNSHLIGSGCPSCFGTKLSNTKEFIENSNRIHNNKYQYNKSKYISSKSKITITCSKHGDFEQRVKDHLRGSGCKKCKNSLGENKLERILRENNIIFEGQYWFEDLKDKNYLHFDIGVLDDNKKLKYLIEFNGAQHYQYVEYFHKTYQKFEIAKYRDQLKKDYCLKNNIPLYIIKYNENISEQMDIILKKEMINA